MQIAEATEREHATTKAAIVDHNMVLMQDFVFGELVPSFFPCHTLRGCVSTAVPRIRPTGGLQHLYAASHSNPLERSYLPSPGLRSVPNWVRVMPERPAPTESPCVSACC